MAFYVGQKVVCIGYPVSSVERWKRIHPDAAFPSLGQVYTIRAINSWPDATLLRFVEVDNRHLESSYKIEPGFNSREFRRPSTRWGEVKAAIQAIATEPEASPAVGDVRALPYLVHLARQRWDGNWSYTLEELAERWLAGQFHNDAAESDAKAALREGGSR